MYIRLFFKYIIIQEVPKPDNNTTEANSYSTVFFFCKVQYIYYILFYDGNSTIAGLRSPI